MCKLCRKHIFNPQILKEASLKVVSIHPTEQTAASCSTKFWLPKKPPKHLTLTDSNVLFPEEMLSCEKCWWFAAVLWFRRIITSVLWMKNRIRRCGHMSLSMAVSQPGSGPDLTFSQVTGGPDNVFPTANHYSLMNNSSGWADLWLKGASGSCSALWYYDLAHAILVVWYRFVWWYRCF